MKAKEYADIYIQKRQRGGVNVDGLVKLLSSEIYTEFKSTTNPRMSLSHISSILDSFMLKGISIARRINAVYPGMLKEKFFYFYIADQHEELFKKWSGNHSDFLSNMNMLRIDPVEAVKPKGFDMIRESLLQRKGNRGQKTARRHQPTKQHQNDRPRFRPVEKIDPCNNLVLRYRDPELAQIEAERREYWDLFDEAMEALSSTNKDKKEADNG